MDKNSFSEILKQKEKQHGNTFSTFLYTDDCEIESCIESRSENFFVIKSGIVGPTPEQAILNKTLPQTLEFLRKEYDYIIMDSSCLFTYEPYVLQKYAGMTFLICNYDDISTIDIKQMREYRNNCTFKNLTVVLNGMESKKIRFYRYDCSIR